MKDFKTEFNDLSNAATRTRENPLSGTILVTATGKGMIYDTVRTAEEYLSSDYSDRKLSIGIDYGYNVLELTPEDRMLDLTAVDIYVKLMAKRGGPVSFFKVEKVEDGKIYAAFPAGSENWMPQGTHIYACVLNAALLSRQNGDMPVSFRFRGHEIVVDRHTKPAEIENLFPEDQRLRTNPKPPGPSQGYGYK